MYTSYIVHQASFKFWYVSFHDHWQRILGGPATLTPQNTLCLTCTLLGHDASIEIGISFAYAIMLCNISVKYNVNANNILNNLNILIWIFRKNKYLTSTLTLDDSNIYYTGFYHSKICVQYECFHSTQHGWFIDMINLLKVKIAIPIYSKLFKCFKNAWLLFCFYHNIVIGKTLEALIVTSSAN